MKKNKIMDTYKIISLIVLIFVFISGYNTWVTHKQDAFSFISYAALSIFVVISILLMFMSKENISKNFLSKVFKAVYLPLMISLYLFMFNIPIILNVQDQWLTALLLVMIFTISALIICALLYIWYNAIKGRVMKTIYYIFYFLLSGLIFYASIMVSFIGAFATA